jgi:hypothetical protein
MPSDTRKLIAGSVLFGAAALTGDALVLSLAGGIGVEWSAEGLGGLWRRATLAGTPGTPVTRAARQAFERAIGSLEAAYRRETGTSDDPAFDLVRTCAPALEMADLSSPDDIEVAQQTLALGLDELLYGHAALDFIKARLMPATARALRAILAEEPEAWRLYHGWLIAQLTEQMPALRTSLEHMPHVLDALGDQGRALDSLNSAVERLETRLDALRDAMNTGADGVKGRVQFDIEDVEVKGDVDQAGGDINEGIEPATPPSSGRPDSTGTFRIRNSRIGGSLKQAGNDINRGRSDGGTF